MYMQIGSIVYPLDASFMTALRYRAAFGVSFTEENTAQGSAYSMALLRLLYTAIRGDKPDFTEFQLTALAEKEFLLAATKFQLYMFRPDKAAKSGTGKGNAIEGADEFHMVANWAICGLPERLLGELSFSQVMGVINAHREIMTAGEKPHVMNDDDYVNIYNITPDAEKRVREYLERTGAT